MSGTVRNNLTDPGLDQALNNIQDETEAMIAAVSILEQEGESDPVVWVRAYLQIKFFKDALDARLKAQNELVRKMVEEHLPRAFDKAGVKTITLDDGRRVTLSGLVRASIKDKEAGYDWLRKNGGEDLIQPTVNASTLAAFARARMEDGEDLPEEYFNVYVMPSVSVTQTK